MSNMAELNASFNFIMRRMVDSGQAPHYTELAAEMGVPV
jgi:hypothetical protein